MKALIKVGYGCNDHCAFCHTLDVRHIDGEAAEVREKIHRAKELGHSMIVLSGGEPTIRPELVAWAELSASLDMDFGLVTNGRMLAYPELVETLLEHRLRYVYLSLHGGTAKVHDLMVRSKAFEETYGSLANLSGRGIDLHVNCVVTKHNMKHLRGVIDSLEPYPDAQLKFSMVEPKGGGDKLFARLMPRVKDVAGYVADALRYGDEIGRRVQHGAIPFCLVPGLEDRFDDLKTHQFRTMSEIGEPDLFPVDDRNKLQPACDGCVHRGACPGLYKGYFDEFGAEEIAPVQSGQRSNSFNYVFERRYDGADGCLLKDGPLGIAPWDTARDLFVRHQGRLAWFRASSRDFSDAEIEHTKHVEGQVYYDVSRKDAPDDFAKDLVQLKRAEDCSGCEHENTCTGMFEATMEPVFARDDERLRVLLRAARGQVVDVGCGESPYVDEFAEAAKAGTLSYLGIDPDGERIQALGSARPWARFVVGEAEALCRPAGSVDVLLFLRSWNHLRDPGRALENARAALKPGGRLIVVDNVAFGLARTKAHTSRAESSRAELEHYRNDDSQLARRAIQKSGFVVDEEWSIEPGRSNQWVVQASRPPR
ncbi:MAG: radical SAM protein [Polyangiales bacterium]